MIFVRGKNCFVMWLFCGIFLSSVLQARAQSSSVLDSGADEQEGWIVRRTKTGFVKVPRKQVFRFEGVDVSGDTARPAESTLRGREARPIRSLLPVRTQFRNDILSDAQGLGGGAR